MISGLMVMGTSTASCADVTSEDKVEAIDVLEAVGIMVGGQNGDFNPDQSVTGNEMAVITANLMEYNVASCKDTSPFTDVPAWAGPYVAAYWTNGITSGYSDTIYGGSDNVTTAQAAPTEDFERKTAGAQCAPLHRIYERLCIKEKGQVWNPAS